MGRLKCFGEYQSWMAVTRNPDVQIFQDWEFPIYCLDEAVQKRNIHPKADAAHTIAMLEEQKLYVVYIFIGNVVDFVKVIDNEWKGRRMCQHSHHRGAVCTNERKAQMGC
jgi:hypothetical protein